MAQWERMVPGAYDLMLDLVVNQGNYTKYDGSDGQQIDELSEIESIMDELEARYKENGIERTVAEIAAEAEAIYDESSEKRRMESS